MHLTVVACLVRKKNNVYFGEFFFSKKKPNVMRIVTEDVVNDVQTCIYL